MTETYQTNFYNPGEIEPRWQKSWEADGFINSDIDTEPTKILCPDHASLSIRRPAHWALVCHDAT